MLLLVHAEIVQVQMRHKDMNIQVSITTTNNMNIIHKRTLDTAPGIMAKGTPDPYGSIPLADSLVWQDTNENEPWTTIEKRNLDTAPKISVNRTPDLYEINAIGRSIGVARHKKRE